MTIVEKLSKIQVSLIAPKNQFNKFGNYNYRSCEDILEGLKPHLKETKTAVTITDEIVQIGDRYYVKATATLHDCEPGGGKISNTAYAREELSKKGMDSSQVTGATSSYARKYALNGLFGIDDVKDADTRDNRQEEPKQEPKKQESKKKEESKRQEEPKKQAKEEIPSEEEMKKLANMKISQIKVDALMERCNSEKVDPQRILELYKVASFEELTEKQYSNINQFWHKIKQA